MLWRGKWIILATCVVGLALGVLLAKTTAKVYGANATIEIAAGSTISPNASPNDLQLASQGQAQTDATVIGTKSFLEVIKSHVLGGRLSAGEIQSRLKTTAVANTSLVQISTTGPTLDEARQLANDVGNQFVQYQQNAAQTTSGSQQEQIRAQLQDVNRQISALARTNTQAATDQLDSLRSARSTLETQLAAVISNGIVQGGSVRLTAPAAGSATPIQPRPMLDALAGFMLGLAAGVGLAWLRARLDRGVHSSSEAEELLGAPLLVAVPERKRFSVDDPVLGEAYDVFRANLAFLGHDRPLQVLTVTSFNPKEGKSSTVEGLAYAVSRGGTSVAVIDSDVRTRVLSTRMSFADEMGLTNVLVGAASLDDVLVEAAPGITLLPAGPTPPNPPGLLASERMRDLIDELRARFSLVIIDSPPIEHLADTSILAGFSDGVVVVARVGTTERSDLVAVRTNLRHSPTPIVGIVVLERRTIDETYYPAVSRGPQRTDADAPGDGQREADRSTETAETI